MQGVPTQVNIKYDLKEYLVPVRVSDFYPTIES